MKRIIIQHIARIYEHKHALFAALKESVSHQAFTG